ncbi:MAG TPA: vWA domain-containing protein, partial [Polyangiales bacterium]|nr:vWA domain-containing protein [Polyangiales bacterium]
TDYPANGMESATECTSNPRSRWTALRSALIDPQRGIVPKLEKVVAFGVVTFGTRGGCPIPGLPVRPGLNNGARIAQELPMVQPGQYTPTGPALDWVYDNWIEAQGPDDRGAAQIVILATDGEPNSCGGGNGGRMGGMGGQAMTNYQPSIDAVKKGTDKGATTYVISLADATGPFHDHLQELANLGNPAAAGKAQLYEPSSPDQLASALSTLVGAAVGCEIELNGSISRDDACSGTVTLDNMPLKCNDPNGWALIDERNIKLQGTACKHVMEKNDALVEASFTCSAFRPD